MAAFALPGEPAVAPARAFVPSLTAAVFVALLGTLVFGPFLPFIARDLEVSVALAGQVQAQMMLLAVVLGLIVGPLADRDGCRRMLLLGLFSVALSAAALALATSWPAFLLLASIGAIGRASVVPLAAMVATYQREPAAGRRALSRVLSGVSLAGIVGVPILTMIGALHWRVAFVALGLASASVGQLCRFRLPPDAPPVGSAAPWRSTLASYAPLLRDRPSLGLIGASVLGNAGAWAMLTYLGAFLVERHGLSAQAVGAVYMAGGSALLVGNVAAAAGARSLLPRSVLMLTRLGGGLAWSAAFSQPLPPAGVALLVALGMLLAGLGAVPLPAILATESRAGSGTTQTLNFSALSLGVALGSAAGGLAPTVADYSGLAHCTLAFSAAAAGLIWWTRPG
jgi:predicted MFS family arabinose efflux permease